jgi:hypothetical protein
MAGENEVRTNLKKQSGRTTKFELTLEVRQSKNTLFQTYWMLNNDTSQLLKRETKGSSFQERGVKSTGFCPKWDLTSFSLFSRAAKEPPPPYNSLKQKQP